MEHVLCSTTVTASSNGTCALQQHETNGRVYNVHPLTCHVIDQVEIVSCYPASSGSQLALCQCNARVGPQALVSLTGSRIDRPGQQGDRYQATCRWFSQGHVQCTVRNGSMKQREELSHINVAGKASPQYICVCTNVLLNGTT